jgi:rare lipoprotein A
MKRLLIPFALAAALTGCGTQPSAPEKPSTASTKPGGYYLDDGPEANPPGNLDAVPDAVPRDEPLHRFANRTYVVLGNSYTPTTERGTYLKEGVASWYGRRFHGRKTASGELYDMYAMTAAHPTLPIPSYARVTALDSGRSVVVRINDRGPFHSKRIVDLSYTAAHKLGLLGHGSGRVRVESLDPAGSAAQQQAAVARGDVYLQVGAFARADNAHALRERLGSALGLGAARTRVVQSGSLHRVQLGPYADDAAAHIDRARVREHLDLSAVLLRRD